MGISPPDATLPPIFINSRTRERVYFWTTRQGGKVAKKLRPQKSEPSPSDRINSKGILDDLKGCIIENNKLMSQPKKWP